MNTELKILVAFVCVGILAVALYLLLRKKKKGGKSVITDAQIIDALKNMLDKGVKDLSKNKWASGAFGNLKLQTPAVKDYLKTLYKPEEIISYINSIVAEKMDDKVMSFFIDLMYGYTKKAGGSFLALFMEDINFPAVTEGKLICYNLSASLVTSPTVLGNAINLLASCRQEGDIDACLGKVSVHDDALKLAMKLASCMKTA